MKKNNKNNEFVLWFSEIGIKDIEKVGGKNASLGEMYSNLVKKGINIPNGFAITAEAFRYFIRKNNLDSEIKRILKGLNSLNIKNLAKRGRGIREIILAADFPEDLEEEILKNYKKLSASEKIGFKIKYADDRGVDVAVRSSATAEDLADASFAGQQESYLNIVGEYNLLDAVKKCFASLFTDRAITYRESKNFDHFAIALSVGAQKMVRSDEASSGVMFTIDTESGFKDAIIINSSYGLGENIVKGKVNPDEFIIHKPTLKKGFIPIIGKNLGSKLNKLVYSFGGNQPTQETSVSFEDRSKFSISDEEAIRLAKWGSQIEDYYRRPMDIEWAKDGKTGELFIVQARPETVQSQKDPNCLEKYVLKEKGKVLASGAAVGEKIGTGRAKVIKNVSKIAEFKPGEILITEMTDPDWVPAMKIASAIVTNSGGRTSHAAIVSRELGVPCVVGTENATEKVKDGQMITASCAEGSVGNVYEGSLAYEIKKNSLSSVKNTKTKIMMNIGSPDQAFNLSFIPSDGVGLAREEFIISEYIRIHPLALINFKKLKNKEAKDKIEKLTSGYKDKTQFYIDKLAEGIGKIAAAFYPKDTIVRMADFKTNEYAALIGGDEFEPKEENPMIGWRGASRYCDEKYIKAFELECKAFKKARNSMGLKNIKIMIPFCRTVEEGRKAQEIMKRFGLERGKDGLEIYVMCEIPSNVILAEDFAQIFDGFSIGSNDLTQLVLGVDRDNAFVSHIYDERNKAVKEMISQVIRKAHRSGRKIGICGQAPSDFPDFAEFLVKEGIDSISLNPDTAVKTKMAVAKIEKT